MASNKWTTQTPIATSSTKLVLAERAYVAPADTDYSDPTSILGGSDPSSPWVDLGVVMDSKVTMNYTKTIKPVETGIEKFRRGSYGQGKTAQATFTLEQVDMDVLELVTGLTKTQIGTTNHGYKIHIGQEDVVEKAILFAGTNMVDNKEHQTYCKKGSVTFAIKENSDSRVIDVTADLYAFVPTGQTLEAFYTLYILPANFS